MNALTLKTLLLSVITEIKFNMPLAKNAIYVKNQFKEMVGLPKRAKNVEVLKQMQRVYTENGMAADFQETVEKFKVAHLVA